MAETVIAATVANSTSTPINADCNRTTDKNMRTADVRRLERLSNRSL
jgi:hypothetical protein